MNESIIQMKNNFNRKLKKLVATKVHHKQLLNKQNYLAMIEKIKETKLKVSNKTPIDYYRMRKYEVVTVGNVEKLIVPTKQGNAIKFYLYIEEIFDILHYAHIAIGHGGRDRMKKELNNKYKNITREMISIYLNVCIVCVKKQSTPKNFIVEPIGEKKFTKICQIKIIEMSQTDDEHKFMLLYQDESTKFIQIRPLLSNDSSEVAGLLLHIFSIFGIPKIVQNDQGHDFLKEIKDQLCCMWPEINNMIIDDAPGSLDVIAADLDDMVCSWLEDNHPRSWSGGLPYIQLMKNQAYNIEINCTPYDAMFGTKSIKKGMSSASQHDARK